MVRVEVGASAGGLSHEPPTSAGGACGGPGGSLGGRSPRERGSAYDLGVSDLSTGRPEDEHEPAGTPEDVLRPAAAGDDAPAQPAPAEATPAAPHDPTEAELAAVAEPARVRRAPKVGAFITVGVLLGALVGLVAALVAGPGSPIEADGTAFISVLEGQGSVRFLMALSGGVVGALVGGLLAVLADRRSVRRRDAARDGADGEASARR